MFELSTSRKVILGILALSIVSMLVVSFVQRMGGTALMVQNTAGTPSAAQSKADALTAEIGQHMQELQKDPNNYGNLVHTSDLLVQSEQWDAAESFLRRAIALDATKAQPFYLLGIVLHNQKKNKEAAVALEKVVAIDNDPSARYSLGVLYMYFLQDVLKGVEHLQKALENPKIEAELRTVIENELKNAKEAIEQAKNGVGQEKPAAEPNKSDKASGEGAQGEAEAPQDNSVQNTMNTTDGE